MKHHRLARTMLLTREELAKSVVEGRPSSRSAARAQANGSSAIANWGLRGSPIAVRGRTGWRGRAQVNSSGGSRCCAVKAGPGCASRRPPG